MSPLNRISTRGWVFWIVVSLGVLVFQAIAGAANVDTDDSSDSRFDTLGPISCDQSPEPSAAVKVIPNDPLATLVNQPTDNSANFIVPPSTENSTLVSYDMKGTHIGIMALADWRGVDSGTSAVNPRLKFQVQAPEASVEPRLLFDMAAEHKPHAPDRGPFTVVIGATIGVGLMLCLAHAKVMTGR